AAPGPWLADLEAYNLFCLGRDAEAEAVANAFPGDRMCATTRLLVALGRPGGRCHARRAWGSLAGAAPTSADPIEAAPRLGAVGRPAEVAAAARAARSAPHATNCLALVPGEKEAVLAFLEGTASEGELLGLPAANDVVRCRRHHAIAWKRLGAGDRRGAE